MRYLLLGFLASSMLSGTAVAGVDPGETRTEQIIERVQAREAPVDRIERPSSWDRPQVERVERSEPVEAPRRFEPAERPSARIRGVAREIERVERVQPAEAAPEPRALEPAVRVQRERPDMREVARDIRRERGSDDSVREWRREQVDGAPGPLVGVPGSVTSDRRRDRWEGRRDARDGRNFDVLADRVAAEGWRRDWRRDRRHDWRRHRDYNRHLYRWGFYRDPFGWSYRPWRIGWYLHPRHFSSRFWIGDPWRFRLPVVYGPYRWVRYYDDVLLVDLRTGRVVDVIRNFFW